MAMSLGRVRGRTYDPRVAYDESTERTYLEAGAEPPWVRVWRDGRDVTDRPEQWTPAEAQMRAEWVMRRAQYGH